MSSNSTPTNFNSDDFSMNGAHAPIEYEPPSTTTGRYPASSPAVGHPEDSDGDPSVVPGEMLLNGETVPSNIAKIKVIGVGGGGCNAVNRMIHSGLSGIDFWTVNTDAQALLNTATENRLQIGQKLTRGLGAGGNPAIGQKAAEESRDEVAASLEESDLVFITAGMGGGTGTGAAPVVAEVAKESGALTVGVVTRPFTFEGRRRTSQGYDGLGELKKYVDTLIVISNDKLRQIYGNLSISDAFGQADNILTTAARGIAEIITVPGYVNVDFEDVNTVMKDSGVAIMGTAAVEGDDRAKRAVDEALHSPLLEDNDIRGARHILLNITSGTKEVTMDEIFEITEFVQEEAGYGTDLIWGNCYDESLGDKICVTVIATGFEHKLPNKPQADNIQACIRTNTSVPE